MKSGMILMVGWLVCIPLFATQYKTFEENGKVGMKDDKEHVILPPSFEALGWSDGSFSVIGEVTGYRLQGLWGIINLKKEFITKAEFENLIYSGGENVVARKKINAVFYKTGSLNLRGETKIPFEYDGIQVQGLRSIVFNLTKSGFRYGIVDNTNRSILPVIYNYIRPLGSLRYAIENDEGKIALFSEEGKPVTDFIIDSVSMFYKGYAIVYRDHLQGLIDRDGSTKLEPMFRSIKIAEDGKVLTQLPNEWSFVSEKNEAGQKIFADELKYVDAKSYYIKRGNLWGVISDELKSIVPVRYESIYEIDGGKHLVGLYSKIGVIDAQNKILIPFLFDSLIDCRNFFRAFKRGQGWQLLDAEGKILTHHFYHLMKPLDEQNFLVESKNFYGLINRQGKEFVHCVFDSISAPVNNLIAVKFKGKYGIVNSKEDWLVAPQDFPLSVINEKNYLQKQPDNQFVKTFTGEVKYFTPYPLKFNNENFIETLPNGVEKTITYDGLIIDRTQSPQNTEEVFRESEGFIGIKKDGRFGFVDTTGRLRIANRYDSIGEFHESLAAIKLIGRWGFVNASDHVAINPNYDIASSFQSGKAIVSRNKKFGIIGKEGNVILPIRYDNIERQSDSFLLTLAGLKGRADHDGNVTIEPRFDSLVPVNSNLFIVCRDSKYGVISDHGMNMIPMIYDQLIFDPSKNIFLAEKKSEWKVAPLD
ncbi:MAG: WG repeat-containing protein [Bacteroidetes bacterium]|nr:WG repeat-containing protein [Bacteroidota bacterium]